MLVAKQVADMITFSRALLALVLAWLGFVQGPAGIRLAAWVLILDWTGDAVDGLIARRSRIAYRTWIGDHDLQVDMLVSGGVLVYLLGAGFVTPLQASGYVLVWMLIFWRWGTEPALGMLFQAPIYAGFIWCALLTNPQAGWEMVLWIAAMVMITWPRFPQMIVPGFIAGIRRSLDN